MVRCLASLIGSLGTLLFMVENVKASNNSVGECPRDSPRKGAKFNVNYCNAHLFLSCDTNYVLMDVTVLAGAGASSDECDKKRGDVYGKTVEMIPAVNKCYWKQNCTIEFPQDRMMVCYNIITNNYNKTSVESTSEPDNCDCTLKSADFLRPIHAKCIKAKDVQTICTGQQQRNVTCLSSQENKGKCINLKKKKGMLRSHDEFPWNYNKYFQNKTFCLQFRVKNKDLVFGVKFVHMCENDSLTLHINGRKKIILAEANETSHYEVTAKEKSATLKFSGSEHTAGCGGFLICYKAERNADKYDGVNRHVCDEFLTEPRMVPLTV